VVVVGSLLSTSLWTLQIAATTALMLLAIRPAAVYLGLFGAPLSRIEMGLIAWFGIRGIGSVYYLSYAIVHGLKGADADKLVDVALATIATSVVVHGVSVTPLMNFYRRRRGGEAQPAEE
jgi:sodium/hydrogen antiporter